MTPDDQTDAEFAAKLEKYRERMAARTAEIKGALTVWLEPRDRTTPAGPHHLGRSSGHSSL
jgi:hypothetical protein